MNRALLVIALRQRCPTRRCLQLKMCAKGKEADQGVGYLGDGTMVCGGRRPASGIGQRLARHRDRSLQTSTGRMALPAAIQNVQGGALWFGPQLAAARLGPDV